jgi:hypothetical protein
MRLPAWAALLLLAACVDRAPLIPADQDTPVHQACRAEARRAPGLAALNAQRNPNFIDNEERIEAEARSIRNRAYRECLRQRGLATPGGVEAARPR